MQRHWKFRRECLLVTVAGLGISVVQTASIADSVPESIRIQQQAEKAYQSQPVVPIERGNAHHRDFQKDDQNSDEVPPVMPLVDPRMEQRGYSR